MYFNTNVNGTNIDKEFNKEEKFNFDKYKKYIFIGLGCILLILGLIFILIGRKKISYYIDLSGNREITIYEGDAYIEPGYTARDSKGNDLTDKVVVNNMIDISTIGTYEIIYTLNNTEVKRIINVLEKPTGATIMYLKGSTTIYLKVGDTYKEPGYKVIDSVDGNLGDKVTVTGRVDTSKVGTYKLIYSVTNNSGVTTSKQRVIVVMDSNISLTLNNEDYTNKNVNINIYVMDNYFDYLILPNGNKVTSKSYTYEASDNGEYKFIIYNKLGEKNEKTIRVKNIDKVSPTGSCSGTYGNGKSNITIKASDNIGIQKYVIDGVSYVNNNITLDREVSSVSVRIYDKALNSKDISCSLSKSGSSKPGSSSIPSKKTYDKVFEVRSYTVAKLTFSYWLYVPEGATENMPLVVFYHGKAENGDDYRRKTDKAISWGPGHEIKKYGAKYNAIILMPQQPNDTGSGYRNGSFELINKIIKDYNIDINRVSIAGFSQGGYNACNIMKNNPNFFSAAVIIGFKAGGYFEYFEGLPTRLFSGTDRSKDSLRYLANKIKESGGDVEFTYYNDKPHNLMNDNFSVWRDLDYDLIEWMISQKKK